MERNAGDGTKGLGRLSVGHDNTIGSVDTRGVLVLTLTDFEHIVLSLIRTVILDTDTIIDVLAEVSRVWTSRIANFETERV